jgi:hypothetical protein
VEPAQVKKPETAELAHGDHTGQPAIKMNKEAGR